MPSSYGSRLICVGILLWAFSIADGEYSVNKILAKHKRAMGGEDVIRRTSSLVRISKVEAGSLVGSCTTWVLPPHKLRRALYLGVTDEIRCFDGEAFWTADPSGEVRTGSRSEQRVARSTAIIEGMGYAFPDSNLAVRYLGREGELGRSFQVLEVLPHEAAPVKMWIEEDTWLVARTEIQAGPETIIREYDDYREVAGLMLAHYIRETEPHFQRTYEFYVEEIKLNEPIPDRLFIPKALASERVVFGEGNATPPIGFDFQHQLILLEGRVNGEGPFRLLLATGASASAVSSDLAGKLALNKAGTLKVRGTGEFQGLPLVHLDTLAIPGLYAFGQVAVVIDPEEMRAEYRTVNPDMILGYDFLRGLATEIRFSDKTVTFSQPSGYAAPAGYGFVSASFDSRIPLLKAQVEERNCRLILDTGNPGPVFLCEPFIKQSQILKDRMVFESELYPRNHQRQIVMSRLKYLSLGPYLFENPVAGFARNAQSGILASYDFDGLLGNEVLRRFDVILDYQTERVALRKSQAFDEEFRTAKSGLILTQTKDGRVVITGLVPGSPADRLRIEPGSELMKLDGQPAAELGVEGIRRIFLKAQEDEELTLMIVEEDGSERSVNLKLRSYY